MIFASDLSTARNFYEDVLGFECKNQTEVRLDFQLENCDLVAFKCEHDSEIKDYSEVARSVFVFLVDSVDREMKRLSAAGVRFLHAVPAENEFSRYAAFADPFGNVHEIYENK
jgi:glyoxylase I family protein